MSIWESQVPLLDAVTREERFEDFFDELRCRYPVDHIVFHSDTILRPRRIEPYLLLTYDETWVSHYFASNYFDIDPLVAEAKRAVLPIDWQSVRAGSRKVRQFFGEAAEFGVGPNGVTIPVHSPGGISAWMTFSSALPDHEWERFIRAHLGELIITVQLTYERVMALLNPPKQAQFRTPELSHMEQCCLRLQAEGVTMAGIADRLRISERTVRGYLMSCRNKLGTVSTTQAIARMYEYQLW